MESDFSIRPATVDDLSKVFQIEQKVHIAPWTVENFRAEIDKPYSQILLLTDDETDSLVAGYIVFWMLFEECQVLNVAVDVPYRGLGFAKQLLNKAIFLANQKELKKVTLDVRKSNLPAIELYQNRRFVIVHVRKAYYGNGEDAYQMTLTLGEDLISF